MRNYKKMFGVLLLGMLIVGFLSPLTCWADGENEDDWQQEEQKPDTVLTIENPLCMPLRDEDDKVRKDADGNAVCAETLPEILDVILYWLRRIGMLIAVAVLAYGGLKLVMAKGNSSKVEEAKEILKYAIIGIAVLIGAGIIKDAIVDFFEGGQEGEVSTLYDQFITLTEYFYSVVLALSIIYIAKGGLAYFTAKGDQTEISDAKKSTFYGLIGLTIILGVWLIIVLISNTIGVAVPKFPFT